MVELELVQVALTGQPVHDLDRVRVARDGSEQPVAPQCGAAGESVGEHDLQRERGIAQPGVTVVPVAAPAEAFRQRRRGGRDNAAGASVGERPQDHEHDRPVLVVRAGDLARPVRPEGHGRSLGFRGVGRWGWRFVGREPGEGPGHLLARRQPERPGQAWGDAPFGVTGRRVRWPLRCFVGGDPLQEGPADHDPVGPGERQPDRVGPWTHGGPSDPRLRPRVVEADPQVVLDIDGALQHERPGAQVGEEGVVLQRRARWRRARLGARPGGQEFSNSVASSR